TFLQALTNDDPEKGGLLKLLNVDIGLILHGEQHYDYYAPVYVGDRITCQQKVTDMYDKKGGALWFVVSETSMKDQAGKLVAKATGITVVRNPDAATKRGGTPPRPLSRSTSRSRSAISSRPSCRRS